jgi:potassium efflux system protein
MAQGLSIVRHIRPRRVAVLLLSAFLVSQTSLAQEEAAFDPIAIGAELDQLSTQLGAETVDSEFLTTARAMVFGLDAQAADCRQQATNDRVRLEARFEPLQDIDADVAPAVFDQRNEIRRLLDEAIARQTQCNTIKDYTEALIERITAIQNQLAQQFLSNRGKSVVESVTELPDRVRSWPASIRSSVDLQLKEGISPLSLFWMLIVAGSIAAMLGLFIRHRFNQWFAAAGGADAPPQMKYLFPKPLAQYSPLLFEGLALVAVLLATVHTPSLDLAVLRIAVGIFLFGISCVVIDWATGPLSPSARVKGLIPDHVAPLRLRLRLFALVLVASFVVLGPPWLAIRNVDPGVSGRATMIFLAAISLLSILAYIRRIPGVQGRIRLIRYAGSLALVVCVFALLIGYQNFAGYLVHGVTRTALALAILWILLWLVLTAFDYLVQEDSAGASQIRRNLGVSEHASRTGIGIMQLVADLIIWISFVVYLIYVWDESGTTLDRLVELVVLGGMVGNIKLVPLNIIGGILVFAALIIVIGWMKRWIDRRWLQHIVKDRGAREALTTVFGYVGFVAAVLIGLTQAGVELGGLVWISSALALGIGFGMQEIANNFVSGLILLFERPIRPGDFVTVGDVEGFVRSIRIRATEIESLDNQNVLVPNSELISGRVTNWVLRDTFGRLRLVVGVAYGTDVEKVKEILEATGQQHPEVITDGRAPGPRALFMGFGDSSLDFELRIRIDRIDRRFSVLSDLNFSIDKAFREENITIPFPQRDLHLISYPEQVEKKPVVTEKAEDISTKTGVYQQPDSVTRSHHEEIEVQAAIEDVWTAITDIEWLNRWLAQDGVFTPQIGGHFNLQLRDGTDLTGRIDVFLPPWRMRFVVALREGDELIASGPETIEFSLHKNDKKSRLSVSVAGIPATEDWEEDYRRSEDRWRNGLVELKEILHNR